MAKTIVGELADLYVKYGGSREDLTGKETTAEMIDAIEQIVGGGSGSSDFVVTYTEDNDTFTADKTFAEILAAYEAGKTVKAKRNVDGATFILQLTTVVDGAIIFALTYPQIEGGTVTVIELVIGHESDETITSYIQVLQNAAN